MATVREFHHDLVDSNREPHACGSRVARFDEFLRARQLAQQPFDWRGLSRDGEHLRTRMETDTGMLWAYQKHGARPCFSPGLLREVLQLQTTLQQAGVDLAPPQLPLRYLIWASSTPETYNLGGDLELFVDLIRDRDVEGLHRYAKACVDVCYLNAINLDLPIVTVALVQGDALGGGFEAVLSNDIIVAERGVRFGLPEVLFNLFPGMGAYSFLSRRLSGAQARAMILSGRLYSAEELAELGLVDHLVPAGEGEAALRAHLQRNDRRHGVLTALARVGRRCQPIDYDELLEVTDVWVETALGLSDADLRRMEHLARAQERRGATAAAA